MQIYFNKININHKLNLELNLLMYYKKKITDLFIGLFILYFIRNYF